MGPRKWSTLLFVLTVMLVWPLALGVVEEVVLEVVKVSHSLLSSLFLIDVINGATGVERLKNEGLNKMCVVAALFKSLFLSLCLSVSVSLFLFLNVCI